MRKSPATSDVDAVAMETDGAFSVLAQVDWSRPDALEDISGFEAVAQTAAHAKAAVR